MTLEEFERLNGPFTPGMTLTIESKQIGSEKLDFKAVGVKPVLREGGVVHVDIQTAEIIWSYM